MSFAQLELAQLLASRICHDLISPVSAVNNGLELLEEGEEDEEMRVKALELIAQSAKLASAKLQIMRTAFGAGQMLSEATSAEEINKLINPLLQGNKIHISWLSQDAKSSYFTQNQARFLVNMLLLCCEALPRGGEISIQVENDGFCFTLTGNKVIFPEDKEAFLCSSEKSLPQEPRLIGLYVVRLLMEVLTLSKVALNRSEGKLQLIFA